MSRIMEFTGEEEGNDDKTVVAVLLNKEEAEALATLLCFSVYTTEKYGHHDSSASHIRPEFANSSEDVFSKLYDKLEQYDIQNSF